MKKFEETLEKFKNKGYEIEMIENGWCNSARATTYVEKSSLDPWGNETSTETFKELVEYEITEYSDGTVEVLKICLRA